jgi:hypothetical protein
MINYRKHLRLIVSVGLLASSVLYFGAYFSLVSLRFGHDIVEKEPSIESVGAYYRVSPRLEVFARWFFEPARLCDNYCFRPKLWEDRQKGVSQ